MGHDIVIKNGKVVDGTGNPWFYADVGVSDGKIVAIGKLEQSTAKNIINADGLVVAPGFVDIHSHADFVIPSKNHPEILEPLVRQGITTLVTGNCGYSPGPVNSNTVELLRDYSSFLQATPLSFNWNTMGELIEKVSDEGVAYNIIPLTSHGATRVAVMGFNAGPANDEQKSKMKELVDVSMSEGCHGMSSGLIYAPGIYSDTSELIECSAPLKKYNGIYSSHIRGSSEILTSSTKEIIKIGRVNGIKVQHSHLEAFGTNHWHKIEEVLELHDAARKEGVDIAFDVIPYVAANTTLLATLPPWSLEGGVPKLIQRLNSPENRRKINESIEEDVPGWPPWLEGAWPHNLASATGWHNIYLIWVHSENNKQFEGRNIKELAEEQGKTPFNFVADLLIAENGNVTALYFGVSGDLENEEPLQKIIKHQKSSINTDAIVVGEGNPHPAAYGTFPKVLRRYVRELRLLTLEEAIRKMTSANFARFGITDRGLIKENYWADITIFDEHNVYDRATYFNPKQYPDGICNVIVNGEIVLDGPVHNKDILAGSVLLNT